MRAELDIDVRWAGEPDVLLKLEPSNKWLMNAVKIGETVMHSPDDSCWMCCQGMHAATKQGGQWGKSQGHSRGIWFAELKRVFVVQAS